jgi:glycosyltransferase involved in cell wall biosynthesis
MPVYNEAGNIAETINNYFDSIVKRVTPSEMIIAEDGSTDGTKEILEALKEKIPFRLVSSDQRKGYTQAVKDALRLPAYEFVFFSDSDGQHDPEDFFKLFKYIEGNDIIIGYKAPRRDPLHRIILSKVYNFIIGILFGLWLKDIDSGFRLIRKKVIEDILNEVRTLKYCISSEFVIRAYQKGYRIKEVPIRHMPRCFGTTSIFSISNLPKIVCGLIVGLVKIKLEFLLKKKKS